MSVGLRAATRVVPNGVPLAREAIRALLGRAFGPPPFDPARSPGDPGLLGPGSASWTVLGDPASIVGGVRALLVQLLHPLAVAGVSDHSTFRDDPLGRLHRTSAYVTVTTFAATRDALAAARRVRAAHRAVTGTAPDGRPYSAADPELLTVVSTAFTASLLAAHRAYALEPLDAATADRFVAEQSRASALLDPRVDLDALAADPTALAAFRSGTLPLPLVDDGPLAHDVASLDALVRRIRSEHAVTEQTRHLQGFLLWPDLPAPLRAGYLPVLAGAVALLDRADLRLLGIPRPPLGGAVLRAQTRALLGGLRVTTGLAPSRAAADRRVRRAPPGALSDRPDLSRREAARPSTRQPETATSDSSSSATRISSTSSSSLSTTSTG